MMNFKLFVFLCMLAVGYSYKIHLFSNAPVVVGATVTFRAEITDDYGQKPSGRYQFKWRDNAMPYHSMTVEPTKGDFTVSYWNVTYPKELYSAGNYEVQVEVARWAIFFWNVGSRRLYFDLTSLLNGGLTMSQFNKTVQNSFVSSAAEVTHHINFKDADQTFLTENATSVISYWFVNCIYYGATSDLTFIFNYTHDADQERHVEALVVASFDPLPSPTTTMAPTTTTTTLAPTTAKPTTTTISTTTSSNNITGIVQPNLKLGTNVSEIPILPYVCLNTSIVSPDSNKTYGYFSGKLLVKAPVSNVVVSGNNWLQHGDILNLSVSCNGSRTFYYCFRIFEGEYNVTNNETCLNKYLIADCQLTVPRYFHNPGLYTVVIIIGNEISKKVTPVGVNIYEVKKHPQLSVIVVPVACSAIAVTLIVFGAAYYMQSRHRYTIEVANFDFAQASDMEYMTFSQRLKTALNSAFNRTNETSYKRLDTNSSQGRY